MVSHLGSPTGVSCELRVGDTPWQNILSVQPGYMAGVAHLYLRLYYQELLEGWSSELCLKRQEDSGHGRGNSSWFRGYDRDFI